MTLRLEKFCGSQLESQIAPHISAIAQLRLEVFRDFPHLYQSTLAYEEKSLQILTQAPRCFILLVFDVEQLVGASIALPLEYAFKTAEIKQRLSRQGYSPEAFMYFYQSALKRSYRHLGVGTRFFTERENYANSLETFNYCCFYAIQRPLDHPQCPIHYVPLDHFWSRCGYTQLPSMEISVFWQDRGEKEKSSKIMQFWMKSLI